MLSRWLKHQIKETHSYSSQKSEIRPHFFPLLTDAPSEQKKTNLTALIASHTPVASWLLSKPKTSKKKVLS